MNMSVERLAGIELWVAVAEDNLNNAGVKFPARMARELVEEVKRLRGSVEEQAKLIVFEVGDIVREVGDDEPVGEIIQIDSTDAFLVELREPFLNMKAITYYREEIALVARPL